MVIVFAHWDQQKGKLMFDLFDVLEIKDSTVEGLTNGLLVILEKKNCSTDTCNVNFGKTKSVSTRLQQKIPMIATIKCSWYGLHMHKARFPQSSLSCFT